MGPTDESWMINPNIAALAGDRNYLEAQLQETARVAHQWKDHSRKLNDAFQKAIRQRDKETINKEAWRRTCKAIVKKHNVNVSQGEIEATYDGIKSDLLMYNLEKTGRDLR